MGNKGKSDLALKARETKEPSAKSALKTEEKKPVASDKKPLPKAAAKPKSSVPEVKAASTPAKPVPSKEPVSKKRPRETEPAVRNQIKWILISF